MNLSNAEVLQSSGPSTKSTKLSTRQIWDLKNICRFHFLWSNEFAKKNKLEKNLLPPGDTVLLSNVVGNDELMEEGVARDHVSLDE